MKHVENSRRISFDVHGYDDVARNGLADLIKSQVIQKVGTFTLLG